MVERKEIRASLSHNDYRAGRTDAGPAAAHRRL